MAGTPPKQGEDEPEIEVSGDPQPAPRPRPKRPRTPNPSVDDVIATGEISQPRSMIIKSSPSIPIQPKIEIREEPTEPVVPRPLPAVAPRRNNVPIIVAAVLVAGGLVAALVLMRGKDAPAAAPAQSGTAPAAAVAKDDSLQAVALFIGTTLDADAHAAMTRAEAMASSSMLRAGIETDAKTLADMAKDSDVAFPVKSGESLEIVQVRDGGRSTLLRVPDGGAAVKAPGVGKTQLQIVNNTLMVVVDAEIPKRKDSRVSGELVLAVPVDLEPMRKKLTNPASLVGLGSPVVLVGGAPGANKKKLPIDTEMKAPLSLEAVP